MERNNLHLYRSSRIRLLGSFGCFEFCFGIMDCCYMSDARFALTPIYTLVVPYDREIDPEINESD